ncbi:MAG: hypothetical protein ACRDID_05440, partial [Ktedonobacterales bacterium]
MDDRDPPSQPRRGLLSGQYHDAGANGSGGSGGLRSGPLSHDDPPPNSPNSGGLLSRFAPPTNGAAADATPAQAQRGWGRLAGGARRLGEN